MARRACEERSDQLTYFAVEPMLDPLRPDPRFETLLRRLKPPSSAERTHTGGGPSD